MNQRGSLMNWVENTQSVNAQRQESFQDALVDDVETDAMSQETALIAPWLMFHNVTLSWLNSQCNRRKSVSNQVDPQNLDWCQN